MGYLGNNSTLTGTQNQKQVTITATADQTDFTIAGGYGVGAIDVYRNGVKLAGASAFTARDGSSVTFLSALSSGDEVEFVVWENFDVAGALQADGNQILTGDLKVTGVTTSVGGFSVGIQSAGDDIMTVTKTLNFVGAGNTLLDRGSGQVDIAIAGGGGGGLGTAIKYADGDSSPFSFIDRYQTVTSNLDLDATNAGASTSFVVSVVPNVEIANGVGVTVGSGKTMIIDVLKIGDL